MKKLTVIILTITFILTFLYLEPYREPVEPIEELIGKNFDYAHKKYFKTEADIYYTININQPLDEFNGGILNKKGILIDTIVHVYTWKNFNNNKTIWVGKTNTLNHYVIDAIRYKRDIKF